MIIACVKLLEERLLALSSLLLSLTSMNTSCQSFRMKSRKKMISSRLTITSFLVSLLLLSSLVPVLTSSRLDGSRLIYPLSPFLILVFLLLIAPSSLLLSLLLPLPLLLSPPPLLTCYLLLPFFLPMQRPSLLQHLSPLSSLLPPSLNTPHGMTRSCKNYNRNSWN